MTLLICAAIVVTALELMVLAYVAGFKHGEADARDAYLEALDWLAEQHKANDRRMRGA